MRGGRVAKIASCVLIVRKLALRLDNRRMRGPLNLAINGLFELDPRSVIIAPYAFNGAAD
jgi:hypothetical protein